MALRKGRTVSVAEKPIYQHCTSLFHEGVIHSFHAIEKDDWQIQMDKDRPAASDLTLNDVKGILRRIDPDNCTWDTKPAKTGKAALLDLSRRLLTALTTGECDERLVIEATALISAA
jgi:hypothetical protein